MSAEGGRHCVAVHQAVLRDTVNWHDDEGTVHDAQQGESGQQGGPMPALFAIGQHNVLATTRTVVCLFRVWGPFQDPNSSKRETNFASRRQARIATRAGVHVFPFF